MAILKFRVYWEDDDSVYRDVVIRHTQNFADLHSAILKSYEFDNKHKATFYRSNDNIFHSAASRMIIWNYYGNIVTNHRLLLKNQKGMNHYTKIWKEAKAPKKNIKMCKHQRSNRYER